ncbi:MAG: O-antigen ligase family protein [Polyangiales bacterium]
MRGAALLGGFAVVVGASAAALHPTAALGIVLGVAAVVWVFSSALNATLAFIVVLVLRPADHFPALAALQPAKLIGLVAILSWLITRLLRGDIQLSRAPHGRWILALAGGVMLSSLMSTHPTASWTYFTDVFIKMLIMYGLVVHLVTTKPQAVKLHLSLALCTVGLALLAIHMRTAGLATVEGNRAGLAGLLGDPNDLALVLLIYVPLFAELGLGSSGFQRLGWFALLAVLVAGIFATVSRGGALGLMAALAFTFYDRGALSVRLILAPTLAAAVLVMLLVAGVNERSSGAFQAGQLDESAQGRLDMWASGIRMTAYNPLFGVGFGQFPDNYHSYARNPVNWEPRDAHNSFIKAAAETGVVGFIPFMALIFLTLRLAYRARKADVPEDEPMERAVRRSMLPSMVGFCVAAFFLSQCWSWFLFILFAQSAAMYDIWNPVPEPEPLRPEFGTMRA